MQNFSKIANAIQAPIDALFYYGPVTGASFEGCFGQQIV